MRSSVWQKIGRVAAIAGAYMAWVIGSGFSTGQEVLQFFSSYGYKSYTVVGVNLLGFLCFGYWLMRTGFAHKNETGFDHFYHFCGKKAGKCYSFLVTATLLLLIPVLYSGGGATLQEYYHIPKPLGSALLAAAVLTVYLIGFEKMVGIISKIGPVMILFSLTVGVISLLKGYQNWSAIPDYETVMAPYRAAPAWWLSGILYLGLNFFPGSTYFVRLGVSAHSQKEIKYGALLGSVLLMLSVTVISTAILLNGNDTAGLDIPVLYLARRISHVFGAVFSVMLVLGIFSSSSVMMWSVCNNLSVKTRHNALTAVGVAVFGYVISLFSFGTLIGTFYPLIGYVGLIYLGCVIAKSLRKQNTGDR